jgi:TonB family protein
MRWFALAVAAAVFQFAVQSAVAQNAVETPPPPVAVITSSDPLMGVRLARAPIVAMWPKGDAKAIADAYEELARGTIGPKTVDSHRWILAEWITALVFHDPAKAAIVLAQWEADDPLPLESPWSGYRTYLRALQLLALGQPEAARQLVRTHRRQAKLSPQLDVRHFSLVPFTTAAGQLDAAEVMIALVADGDAAARRVASSLQEKNPFLRWVPDRLIIDYVSPSCAEAQIEPSDWVILQFTITSDGKSIAVQPLAASRGLAATRVLSQIEPEGLKLSTQQYIRGHQLTFVRCARAEPRPTLAGRYLEATRQRLLALQPAGGPAPTSVSATLEAMNALDAAGQYAFLWGIALRRGEFPDLAARAVDLLQVRLTKAGPGAREDLWTMRFRALPNAGIGNPEQVELMLPVYEAFVNSALAEPGLSARQLSWFDNELAQLYRIVGRTADAQAALSRVIARAPQQLADDTPEYYAAQLSLAAILQQKGQVQEASGIIGQLGLSPEQCSLYQSEPQFQTAQFPGYPPRLQMLGIQGRLQIEFDQTPEGKPKNSRILVSTPPFAFDDEADRFINSSRLLPATRGNSPVGCEAATRALRFVLQQ